MVTKVLKVFETQERTYTDKQGVQQQWKSKGFIFHDGRSSFYAEANQEVCASIEALKVKVGDTVMLHVFCYARTYKDKEQRERVNNEMTILNMTKL